MKKLIKKILDVTLLFVFAITASLTGVALIALNTLLSLLPFVVGGLIALWLLVKTGVI